MKVIAALAALLLSCIVGTLALAGGGSTSVEGRSAASGAAASVVQACASSRSLWRICALKNWPIDGAFSRALSLAGGMPQKPR